MSWRWAQEFQPGQFPDPEVILSPEVKVQRLPAPRQVPLANCTSIYVTNLWPLSWTLPSYVNTGPFFFSFCFFLDCCSWVAWAWHWQQPCQTNTSIILPLNPPPHYVLSSSPSRSSPQTYFYLLLYCSNNEVTPSLLFRLPMSMLLWVFNFQKVKIKHFWIVFCWYLQKNPKHWINNTLDFPWLSFRKHVHPPLLQRFLREGVKYYFADFFRKGGGGGTP